MHADISLVVGENSKQRPFVILILLLSISIHLSAQPVTFINHSDWLTTVPGFVDYADCAVDMNGDFLDDVVRVGGKGIFIDFQNPDGKFRQKFFNLFVQEFPSWSICAGDLDNNGYNDLLFANNSAVSFVKANDSGTEYTETVMPGVILSQRSTIADINNDGWLDAFVCNDTAMSVPFRNDGNGNMFPDTNLIHTSNRPGAYSAIWTDYDNDTDIDLYITKCKGGAPPTDPDRINLMYRNNGDGTFTEVASEIGLDDNAQSWSTSFEDFDNDGDFDAFIVNHDFQNRLFRNNGDGTFTDVIATSGINPIDLSAFENSTGDFNNDGFMDIFSDLEQGLYLGNGDLTFTGQAMPVIPGAIADLNNDGFLDVMHASKIWINQATGNHWIKINTLGLSGNRNGIGARVEIYGSWGVQIREVRSGQSYSPMSSLNIHFGLGQSENVDSLVVKWGSGIITSLTELTADSVYIIPEADCVLPQTNLSIRGDTSICPGTNVLLTAPSGFNEYKWSNHATGQEVIVGEEGFYFAIMKDSAGCISLSNVVNVQITEETVPVITASNGNHVCEGDTLVLTASSGENYVWSNGSTEQRIVITDSGNFTVAVDAVCSAGKITSAPYAAIILPSPAPEVFSDFILVSGDSILLAAEGANIHWYDANGFLLDTGSTFQTPPLDEETLFFVESHHHFPGEIQSGGKPDTTGNGGLPEQGGYLLFEAWEPFTLLSITVYVPQGAAAGTRFVQLVSADTIVAVKQFIVQPGENILDLNFTIPVGQFSLRCPQGNLFRNTEPLTYPYAIGEAGQITTSSFGDNFYYYFYDWKIRTPDYECISPRIPVYVLISRTQDPSDQLGWLLYPNPTDSQVLLELENDNSGIIQIVDVTGKEIMYKNFSGQRIIHLDISRLPSGVYSVQLWRKGKFESKRLVIR